MREIEQEIVDSLRFAQVVSQNDQLWMPIPQNVHGQTAVVVVGFKDTSEARKFCLNLQNSKVI